MGALLWARRMRLLRMCIAHIWCYKTEICLHALPPRIVVTPCLSSDSDIDQRGRRLT